MIASEYASSPEAAPAHQQRIGSSDALAWMTRGSRSRPRDVHASGARKKLGTLIKIVLKSCANSSGGTWREARDSANSPIPTCSLRFWPPRHKVQAL